MSNTILYSVGVAVAAIGLLGWVVYLSNPKSVTNRTFFYFSIISILWNLSNFFVYQVSDPQVGLWFVRLNIFFAVWYSFFVFRLFFVFPEETKELSIKIRRILYPALAVVSILTLTPLVLGRVLTLDSDGHVSTISNGPLIFLFGMTAVILISTGIYLLLKKISKSSGSLKNQLNLVGTGTIITFTLHIIFNLIFPAFLNIPQYASLGAVFTFPIIFFTSYAILRRNLLNIKILTTEIVSIVVLSLTFVEVIISKTTIEIVFRVILFVGLLFLSYLLIRSVRKEVEQREELAKVNKQIEDANQHLKELDQAKSEFVSIASHQLRTPMTGIMGYLSMMTDGDFGKIAPEHQKILVDLLAESQRMIRLINQFLNVSKIEAGRLTYQKTPVHIEDIIRREILETTKVAADKGLKIINTVSNKTLPTVMADGDKLQDVVINLIDNAIKYTERGTITISAEQLGNQLHLAVKDTGIGLNPKDAGNLFNKFVRGSGVAKINPNGSGLGLFFAKSIIDYHGGRIWAESEGEGKGSTFQFTIPINPPPDPTTPIGRAAAAHVVKEKTS